LDTDSVFVKKSFILSNYGEDKLRLFSKMAKKYVGNVFKPKPEEVLPGHPGLVELFKPLIMVDKQLYPDSKLWVHMYHIPKMKKEDLPKFKSNMQVHDADEIHMTMGPEGAAKARWILEGEEYIAGTPSTTYIPAGVKHSNEWLEINEPVTIAVAILQGERRLL